MPPFEIRPEISSDPPTIRDLTARAFEGSSFGHNGEADLIDAIREAHGPSCLSLVATTESEFIGHILFSPAFVQSADATLTGMGLGPMAVSPEFQRLGVGSALVAEGLLQLREAKSPFVIVLGDNAFYERFGFTLASEFGVLHGFDGIPKEHFLFQSLADDTDLLPSKAYYVPEFGPQHTGT